jgi:predicted RNA methylase
MNAPTFNRLHGLRMENDEAGYRMDEMRPRFQALAQRHETGTAPRAVTAFQLFQTPPAIAAQLVAMIGRERLTGAVLEPSAGLGRILDAIRPSVPVATVAVEVAPQIAAELYRQQREGVKLVQRDFLATTPAELGLFDAVVMNPPFHMRADIRHIEHARRFLKPGGRLAAICLDTHHREKALKPIASQWIKLDAGAFKNEGTNVATVMLTIDN